MTSLKSSGIIIAFIVAVLLVIAFLTYNHIEELVQESEWVNHTIMVKAEVEGVMSAVIDAQTAHRGYALTRDSSFLEPYITVKNNVANRINIIDSLTQDHQLQHKRLDSLRGFIVKQFSITDEILTRTKQESGVDYYGMNLLRIDEQNMTRIRRLIENILAHEDRLLGIRTTRQEQTFRLTPVFLLSTCVFALVALYYLFFQLQKSLRIRLKTEQELERNLMLLSQEVNEKEMAQESLRKVIDSSSNGIVFMKAVRGQGNKITDMEYVMANKLAGELLNVPSKELVGSRLRKQFVGLGFDDYKEVVETGRTSKREFYFEQLDVWLTTYATKLEDGCVVTFDDITESKENEKELLLINEQLRELNQNLEQFAYVASHDLQEPLRKIRAFGDRLQTKFKAEIGKKGNDYIERMNSAASRMQVLINDLLKYSRTTRKSRDFEEVDLNELINEIMIDLESRINDTKAKIEVSRLGVVKGDKVQLRQLFQNLISNAIKFTPGDRKPEVRIKRKLKNIKEVFERVEARESEQFVVVSVEDNGIGFKKEYADRVFKIFERLHGRSEYQGTGIGLAICQKVVQNHNGYIKAESEEGEGAKFIVALPKAV